MCSTYVLSLARLDMHKAVKPRPGLCKLKRVGHFLPLAASRHTSNPDQNAACSRLSIAQFANGPKRSMGHLLGAKNSFAVRRRTRPQGGRAGLILSIPAKQVSLEAPRVDTRHGQAPIPHARRLPSVHTYKQGPLRSTALVYDLPKFWIQSSLASPKRWRMRRRRLPDPRPTPEGVRAPIYIRKK